ncbi:MAG: anaerobic sulfite reductase subunit AsrB [Vallitaleaceae bacterium]|nr:anaerobic sulfite reductase subunit AsrB [Vallitaleaceae bacterium]
MHNPYMTQAYEVLEIRKETEIDYTYRIAYEGKPLIGGQFMEISMPGVGEAPISISFVGDGFLEMTIRKVGRLTDRIFEMKIGDFLQMRGPYGNGFELEHFRNKDLAFIAGGTGLAPVRNTIHYFATHPEEVKNLELLVGFKSPKDRLFVKDLEAWSKDNKVVVTVDQGDEEWQGEVGLITKHIEQLDLSQVASKVAIVVGPPIMMKFTTLELVKKGFLEENIWVSFERKMSCGIGKCGHCKIDETYVCLEGPVFPYTKAKQLLD